jgi:DNA replication protein DnaC
MSQLLTSSTLEQKLKTFRLSGMIESLRVRLKQAKEENLSHAEFLGLLCEDEENTRADNKRRKLYQRAKLPSEKGLEDFEFAFQPSINKREIMELATCQFLDTKTNVFFIGQSGVGKTHLSNALGLQALGNEKTVLFTTVWNMITRLQQSRADLSYPKKIQMYVKPDLLILDELGYRSLAGTTVEDFYEIISQRHEKRSTIITSNLPVAEWDKIFVHKTLASAIVDRLIQHSRSIEITGESYRFRHRD